MTFPIPEIAHNLGRIADALEDLVKLQIASLGGQSRVGGLHCLKGLEKGSEDQLVLYTDDLEDASRELEATRLGWLKGTRKDGPGSED